MIVFQLVGVNQHTQGSGQAQERGHEATEHNIRSDLQLEASVKCDLGRDLECDSECGSGGDTRHGGGGESGGQMTHIRRGGDLHHV